MHKGIVLCSQSSGWKALVYCQAGRALENGCEIAVVEFNNELKYLVEYVSWLNPS